MITYRFEPDQQMSAAYDGQKRIGMCQYTVQDEIWKIVHTEVMPEYGGQGIARRLVMLVADEARKQNKQIIPVCSYAVKVLG